jgi:uncharacterized protein
MIDGIKAKFRELKSAGLIIDGDCWYDASANDKETLKAGKLFIDYGLHARATTGRFNPAPAHH